MAFKYKIQILGGSSVINTVNAGDLNNPVSTATFNTKDLSASVNGGNVDITNLAADKVVLSNIPHADIINSGNLTWGGTASQVVTNLNLEFKVSAHTIGEIQGVTITGTPDASYQGKGLVFDGAGNLTVSSSALLNTSYSPPPQVETDPVFTASPAFSITNTNKSNWDTAYGWGDHAAAGYVTAASETLATITGRGATTTTTSIIPFNYANQAAFPSSSTYKGAIAYSDADKAMFVSTGTSWLRIANQTEVFDRSYTSLTNVPTSFTPSAHNQAWSTITSTPTTIAGYGITDAFNGSYTSLSNVPSSFTPSAHTQAWSTITSTPTTIAGYGITDAFNGQYSSLSGIPSTFTPSAHTHTASEITDFDTEVSNNTSVAANTAKVGYTDAAVDLRIAAASIDDLSDVDTSTVAPTTGQALVWDGTQWEPGTVSGGGSSLWTASGSDIYYTAGNVGIGTTTPSQPLHVSGNAKVDGQLIIQDGTFSHIVIGNGALPTSTSPSYGGVIIGNDAARFGHRYQNVIIGQTAGYSGLSQSDKNVAIGANSLKGGQARSNNVAIGYDALAGDSTTTASNTVAIGYQALTALTTGANNTAVGYQAGATITTGSNNTLFGSAVDVNNATNSGCTIIGAETVAHANASSQTGIGHAVRTGVQGTSVGAQAGSSTSINQVAFGYRAGNLASGTDGTQVGKQAGRYVTGNYNTLIGSEAGQGTSGTSTFANTVAVGYQALTALTTGAGNTAVGYQAGDALTIASGNTLIGTSAGSDLTNGNNNTLIGSNSGLGITNGVNNVFVGRRYTGLNSSYRISLGHNTGASSYSVVIGDDAAKASSWSQGITAIGHKALTALTSGANSVAIGYLAGAAVTTGGNNILIGYQAGSTLTTESNKLYIENSNSTTPLIYGEFDNDILRVNGTLQVNDPSSTGYSFPTATGTLGQVLEVDANGDLVFATPSGGSGGGLGTADQTLTGDRLIDTNGYNLAIELDPTGTADTFTIHDGTHDLFQVDTSTTGVLFSVNDVSGLPKLEVDEDEGVIAKSIKVDDSALTVAGQYGKGAEIWYQGTSTPTAGSVYYLDSSGNWANTDASAVATAKGMLSVSAGTDSDVDGMVIKGFVYVGTDPGGNVGDVVYLSETANQLTTTAPTTASAVVRVCGYKVGTNIVYFDPSKDWIELS